MSGLKIETEKGSYDLPEGFQAEFEVTNPVFTKKGSQTVAANLPDTPNNRFLTGHVGRLDRKNRASQKERVTVKSGAFVRMGVQAINGATKEGISISIGLDEGEMYAKMNEMKLADLPNLPVFRLNDTSDVNGLIDHLNNVMKERLIGDYEVFPILVSFEKKEDSSGSSTVEKYFVEWLNEVDEDSKLLVSSARVKTMLVNGEETDVSLPTGYGISPFIKVSKVLRLIFESFGYYLNTNEFDRHYQLRKMVLLNNTVDTIVKGVIDYRHLMPDEATVSDLLTCLWVRFGVKFYVNSNTREVKPVFIKDTLTASPAGMDDFTELKASKAEFSSGPQKQLKLSASKSIEGAATGADTFDEFLKKYSYTLNVSKSSRISPELAYYLVMFQDTGNFYTRPLNETRSGELLVSSSFFDWDQKTEGIEYEELTAPDECVPMLFLKSEWQIPNRNALTYPAYRIGAKHVNTDYRTRDAAVEDKNSHNKLALCFKLGELYSSGRYLGYYAGSSLCIEVMDGSNYIDKNGNIFVYSLTFHDEYGAYMQFHKEYDAFLRHSNQTVSQKFNLDKVQLSRLDLSKQVIMDSQPFLTEKANYSIGENAGVASLSLRTTKLYEPYDLSEDRKMPQYVAQAYYWKAMNTINEVIEAKRQELLSAYPDALSIRVSGQGITQPVHETPTSVLPPSESDYSNGIRIDAQEGKVVAIFQITFGGYFESRSETLDFSAWFEAAIINT